MRRIIKENRFIYRFIIIITGSFLWFCFINILNNIFAFLTSGFNLLMLYLFVQWVLPVYVLSVMKREGLTVKDLGFEKKRKLLQIFYGLLLGVGLFFINLAVIVILKGTDGFGRDNIIMWNNIGKVIFIFIYNIFGVAFNEEIFFRGYLLGLLRKNTTKSNFMLVIITACIFGGFHLGTQSLVGICRATVIGGIFAFLRVRGFSLNSLIIAHGLYNSLSLII